MTGAAKHTVLKLLKDVGCAAAAFHNEHVRNLRVRRIQCDEIWAFIYAKQKNVTEQQMAAGAGDVWTWTAIDADSKLIVSYMLGDRGPKTAMAFMQDVASRLITRIQLTTDGHRVYADAVEGAFFGELDYAMLVKIFGAAGFPTMQNRATAPQRASDAAPPSCWRSRPEAHQYIVCGTVKPFDANGNAPLHSANQRVQQETGESRPHGGPILLSLQLLQNSSDASRDSRNGSRDCGSRLVC